MLFSSLPKLLQRQARRAPVGRGNRRRPCSPRLQLDYLEDRLLLATITVTSALDLSVVDGAVSLREAITSMNGHADVNGDVTHQGTYGTADRIQFALGTPGSVVTI